jgi:hypothetical protein
VAGRTRAATDQAVHKALNLFHRWNMGSGAFRSSRLWGFADASDGSGGVDVATVLPRGGRRSLWDGAGLQRPGALATCPRHLAAGGLCAPYHAKVEATTSPFAASVASQSAAVRRFLAVSRCRTGGCGGMQAVGCVPGAYRGAVVGMSGLRRPSAAQRRQNPSALSCVVTLLASTTGSCPCPLIEMSVPWPRVDLPARSLRPGSSR